MKIKKKRKMKKSQRKQQKLSRKKNMNGQDKIKKKLYGLKKSEKLTLKNTMSSTRVFLVTTQIL